MGQCSYVYSIGQYLLTTNVSRWPPFVKKMCFYILWLSLPWVVLELFSSLCCRLGVWNALPLAIFQIWTNRRTNDTASCRLFRKTVLGFPVKFVCCTTYGMLNYWQMNVDLFFLRGSRQLFSIYSRSFETCNSIPGKRLYYHQRTPLCNFWNSGIALRYFVLNAFVLSLL